MAKLILKFISIWSIFFLTFVSFAVYRDIKVKKVFNYSKAATILDYKKEVYEIDEKVFSMYQFLLKSDDDYLGAILFPLKSLDIDHGKVAFRLRADSDKDWFIENDFDISYFKDFGKALYGIPTISTSKGVVYNFEVIIESDRVGKDIDKNILKEIEMKYVFPRSIAVNNYGILFSILTNRLDGIFNVIYRIELIYLSVLAAFITLFILFLTQKSPDHISTKKLFTIATIAKKILNPRYSFYATFGILIVSLIQTVLGNIQDAEKSLSFFFILLLLSSLSLFYKHLNLGKGLVDMSSRIIKTLIVELKKNNHHTLKVLIGFTFFCFVLVSGLKKTYILGGDDTRLYFVVPQLFLSNFSSKIVSETALSTLYAQLPQTSNALTIIMMIILKSLVGNLNLQAIMYNANLLFGVISFYIFLKWVIKEDGKAAIAIYLLSSFTYVFSIFNFYTLLNSNLISVFLISTFPIFLYCIFRGIGEKKIYFLIPPAILASLFSYFSLALPVFAASIVALVPLFLYFLFLYRLRFILFSLFLGVLLIFFNLYWIVYIPTTSAVTASFKDQEKSLISTEYRQENERGIRVVSEINSVYYPLLNTYHKAIQENFNWPFLSIYRNWYEKIIPFNFVFISAIVFAGITIKRRDHLTKVYMLSLLCFLWCVYLFTVNITAFGVDVFVWLNSAIPGFVLFRNMFDKFAFPLSFAYAFLLATSLALLSHNVSSIWKRKAILIFVGVVSLLNAYPYLLGWFQNTPLWTTRNIYSDITQFNIDYIDLISDVRKNPDPARYASFPLSAGNSFHIEDPNMENHFYNGASPFVILTGKNDLSGVLSFGPLGSKIQKAVKEKDSEEIGKILQMLNTKYIIVSNRIPLDLASSFAFAEGFFFYQDKSFIQHFLGNKIKDYGERYSLYRINEMYNSEKIYLTDDVNVVPKNFGTLEFTRKEAHLYQVSFSRESVTHNKKLVFLEMNLPGWSLYDSGWNRISNRSEETPFGYAMAWDIDPESFFDNDTIRLYLYYDPYNYYKLTIAISIVSYILAIGTFVYMVVIKKKGNNV